MAALARILATPAFRSSRRRTLLAYLVEETMAGRGDRLKGYAVATAVFGRGEDFDSQSDPVVRLEARRLRRDLDSYYAGDGLADPVRLSIPKGGYAVQVDWNGPGVSPAVPAPPTSAPEIDVAAGGPARLRRRPAALLAAVALFAIGLVAAAAWLISARNAAPPVDASGPAVIVLPFKSLGEDESGKVLAAGVSQQLISELMRFSSLRVFSPGASFDESADANATELGRRLGVSYVVSGSITTAEPQVRVSAQVVDAASGEVRWSESFDRTLSSGALLEVQGDIAAGIASVLGQPYGVVKGDITRRVLTSEVPSMASYACVLQAYVYRRGFPTELYAPTRACLEEAVARDPSYADAWAMLGWLQMDGVRFGFTPDLDRDEALGQALETVRRAAELDPKSVTALQALASIEYYAGYYDEAERTQRAALVLNPNDPDTLAQLGWRLAARGKWDEGIPFLERAIARTVQPPGWYYHLVAIYQYLQGDYTGMLDTATKSAVDGSGIGQSLIAIAEGALGNPAAAHEALARMTRIDPDLARDPGAIYRSHQGIESTVDALVAGLRKAGWTPAPNP
jgi:TolB-like protein